MGDEKKGFTVKDRRHFTSEGDLRGPVGEEPATPAPSPDPSKPPAPEPRTKPEPGPDARAASDPAGAVSFASFLMSLGSQAGALLDSEDAADAEAARQIISILEMLKDKTQGRLSPDEQRLHEGLLYELRMAYLERNRTAKA
jgi:hypothetical protein